MTSSQNQTFSIKHRSFSELDVTDEEFGIVKMIIITYEFEGIEEPLLLPPINSIVMHDIKIHNYFFFPDPIISQIFRNIILNITESETWEDQQNYFYHLKGNISQKIVSLLGFHYFSLHCKEKLRINLMGFSID